MPASKPDFWDLPAPFVMAHQVSEADIDGLQHTNNAVYVQWCEQVSWEHSASLGMDLNRYRELDRAMAVFHAEYDYLQASRLGEELLTATWITHWDQKLSMWRRFQVVRAADGQTLLRGKVKFVCIEISSGKPKRMPAEFIDSYSPAILNIEAD